MAKSLEVKTFRNAGLMTGMMLMNEQELCCLATNEIRIRLSTILLFIDLVGQCSCAFPARTIRLDNIEKPCSSPVFTFEEIAQVRHYHPSHC